MMKSHKILRVRTEVILQKLMPFKIQNIGHHFAIMKAESKTNFWFEGKDIDKTNNV